jgi:hypothetical protein
MISSTFGRLHDRQVGWFLALENLPPSLRKDWPQALRAAGIPIEADWIDSPLNFPGGDKPTPDQWSRHWRACIDQAAAADITLFVANEGETQCGALCEIGAALAAGRQVFVVSDYDWSIAHHPTCRTFPDLSAAIRAIKAQEAVGSRVRERTDRDC